MLKKITRSPYLNLISGLILISTAAIEVIETFGEDSIGAHHGILVFGIIQIAKAITEIMHGLKEVEDAKENLTFQSTAAVVSGSSRGGRLSAGQVTEQGQR